MLLRAFERDFEVNGPSVVRIARTMLQGWRRHKHHPERRVRERFARECAELATSHSAALWAAERWLADNAGVRDRIRRLRREMAREFGWRSRVAAALGGPFLLGTLAREEHRLARGLTYEPPTCYELNPAAAALDDPRWREAKVSHSVSGGSVTTGASKGPAVEPHLAPAG